MPHGGIVDLLGIRVIRVSGQLRVLLLFADSANRHHSVSYDAKQFLAAMTQIASSRRESRLAGLKALGVYTEEGRGTTFYRIRLDGNFIGSLGDLQTGAGNDLLLMLHEDSPRPTTLRDAVRDQREIYIPNPLRH